MHSHEPHATSQPSLFSHTLSLNAKLAQRDLVRTAMTPDAACHATTKKQKNRADIMPDPGGHRPQHPCAQGRTGADTYKTESGAGKRAEAKPDLVRRRSNHAWMADQAGKRKCANTDAAGG